MSDPQKRRETARCNACGRRFEPGTKPSKLENFCGFCVISATRPVPTQSAARAE